jgi:hypothetical protein
VYEEWRYRSIILDISTRWRWVVSFMPQLLYPRRKNCWYPLYRMLFLVLFILTAKCRPVKFDSYILHCAVKVNVLKRILETSPSEKNSFHVQRVLKYCELSITWLSWTSFSYLLNEGWTAQSASCRERCFHYIRAQCVLNMDFDNFFISKFFSLFSFPPNFHDTSTDPSHLTSMLQHTGWKSLH